MEGVKEGEELSYNPPFKCTIVITSPNVYVVHHYYFVAQVSYRLLS